MAYLNYNLATAKYTKDACSHFSQVRLQLVFSFRGGRSFSNLRVCQKMNGPRLCHLYGRLCHLYLCHPWLCETTMGRSLVSSDIW